MTEDAQILFANEAFYAAFAAGDFAAMDRLWARAAEIACVHPGWPPLFGRVAVIGSWRGILESPQRPAIAVHHARAVRTGPESAMVLCYEQVAETWLLATNLFVREADSWRMVHHHAGPVPRPEGGQETRVVQ